MIDLDKLVPLPAPILRFEVGINRAGERMDYTAKDMRAIRLAAWNAAIKAAAKESERYQDDGSESPCVETLLALRIEPSK